MILLVQLFDSLRQEHELIDAVLGSLRTYVERRARHAAPANDGRLFRSFFEVYAGHFHHEREEEVLFPALIAEAGVSSRGPLQVLLNDHAALAATLAELGRLLETDTLAPADIVRMEHLATEYSHALWHHMDAENSVLFPEAEQRLKHAAVFDLPSRLMNDEEIAVQAVGRQLTTRYPPFNDAEIIRGEGCVVCPAYGDSCRGLEKEWWNEWEWEELGEHVAAS